MDDYYKGLLFSLCGNVAINLGHHLKAEGEDRKSAQKPGQKLIHGKILRSSNGGLLGSDCGFCINKKVIFWVIGTSPLLAPTSPTRDSRLAVARLPSRLPAQFHFFSK